MLPREGKRVASADQVTRDFSRSWKRNDPDQVAAFFARDAIYTDGPKGTHRGREAIRQEVAAASDRFPAGFDVTVQSLVSDGRTVMVKRTDRFEAGNPSIDMDVAGAFEINDEGLIVR
jgi:limonene-1,2-epoxide hydrolase